MLLGRCTEFMAWVCDKVSTNFQEKSVKLSYTRTHRHNKCQNRSWNSSNHRPNRQKLQCVKKLKLLAGNTFDRLGCRFEVRQIRTTTCARVNNHLARRAALSCIADGNYDRPCDHGQATVHDGEHVGILRRRTGGHSHHGGLIDHMTSRRRCACV